MESPGRCGDWLAPPPSPPRGSRSQSTRPARGRDFYLATSGDPYLATSGDFFMATDTLGVGLGIATVPRLYVGLGVATASQDLQGDVRLRFYALDVGLGVATSRNGPSVEAPQ